MSNVTGYNIDKAIHIVTIVEFKEWRCALSSSMEAEVGTSMTHLTAQRAEGASLLH